MALFVNGQRVEDIVIQQEAERLRPEYEKTFADMEPKQREAQLLDWSRENIIERTLLLQEAKRNTLNIAQSEVEFILKKLKEQYDNEQQLYEEFNVETVGKLRETIELYLALERKIDDINNALPKPSSAEMLQYYQENKEQFKVGEKVRIAHIVKYVNWQADESSAYEQIRSAENELRNEVPFETVVEKYTDCDDINGDIGYVVRGQLAEEFEDVVFNLDVGQVSDIFRTRFGYHIAKVYDRIEEGILNFEKVKVQISEQIKEQAREKALEQLIDQLKSTAQIEDI